MLTLLIINKMKSNKKTTGFRFENENIKNLISRYSNVIKTTDSSYVEDLIIDDLQNEETYDRIIEYFEKLKLSSEELIKEIKQLKKTNKKYYRPEMPDV